MSVVRPELRKRIEAYRLANPRMDYKTTNASQACRDRDELLRLVDELEAALETSRCRMLWFRRAPKEEKS